MCIANALNLEGSTQRRRWCSWSGKLGPRLCCGLCRPKLRSRHLSGRLAAWSCQFAAVVPPRPTWNLPTDNQTTEGCQTSSLFPSSQNHFPNHPFHIEFLPRSRCARPSFSPQPPHRAPSSNPPPPISAARDQANKMAPEPTADHPEHKKKVNLTYVSTSTMHSLLLARWPTDLVMQRCLRL